MQLNFKQNGQSEDNAIRDRITACMETGNHDVARATMAELQHSNPVLADSIRMDVLQDYGMSL